MQYNLWLNFGSFKDEITRKTVGFVAFLRSSGCSRENADRADFERKLCYPTNAIPNRSIPPRRNGRLAWALKLTAAADRGEPDDALDASAGHCIA
jgi:hypothetical protein